jgi:hypothetical protein
MSTADRTAALVAWWVATYSRHLPAEVADRRRAELASDLWEQRAWGRTVGAPAPAVALSVLRRMTAGIPADLRWRQQQLAATRGRPPVPGGQPVLRTLARNWWLILAALVGLFEIAFGVAMPFEEGGHAESLAGGALIATAGLLMLSGIAVRRRRSRVAGDIMIAIGPLPIVALFWLILPPLAGIIVIVAAAFDSAEARSLGERGRPLDAGERLLLAGVVLAAAAFVALLIAGSMPGTLFVAPVLLGLIILLGLRQRRHVA